MNFRVGVGVGELRSLDFCRLYEPGTALAYIPTFTEMYTVST